MLSFVFFCVFLFDCSITGGGKLISFGPVSLRMVSGFAALVFCLPKLFRDRKKHLRNPVFRMFAAFLVWLAVCAVHGLLAENRLDVLSSDLKGFMWLFLVPVAVVTLDSSARMNRILDVLLVGATVQAIFVLTVNAFCVVFPDTFSFFYELLPGALLGLLDRVSGGVYRIFMRSCPYLFVACSVAMFRLFRAEKVRIRYLAVIALCLCALVLSYTRSVFGGVFICLATCAAVSLFVFRNRILTCLKRFFGAVAVFLAVLFVLEFAFEGSYLNFAISRTFHVTPSESAAVFLRHRVDGLFSGDGYAVDGDELLAQEQYMQITESSDGVRAQTKSELGDLIRKSPLIGNGLGASAPCREDGLDEYFYLDMLARTGIVGLVLYLAPFGWITFVLWRERRRFRFFGLYCGTVALWAVTWFNPWMNAVLGIACYALCCAFPSLLSAEKGTADNSSCEYEKNNDKECLP